MNIKKLVAAGVDYDDGLRRFSNNENLFVKFLKKFCEDTLYEQLEKALAEKDYDQACAVAHTLKGVAGNLSITVLYSEVSKLVEILRGNLSGDIDTQFQRVATAYETVRRALAQELMS